MNATQMKQKRNDRTMKVKEIDIDGKGTFYACWASLFVSDRGGMLSIDWDSTVWEKQNEEGTRVQIDYDQSTLTIIGETVSDRHFEAILKDKRAYVGRSWVIEEYEHKADYGDEDIPF